MANLKNDSPLVGIYSCEIGEENAVIVTKCSDRKVEWTVSRSTDLMNGVKFVQDNLTEIERSHYGSAIDCFNINFPD